MLPARIGDAGAGGTDAHVLADVGGGILCGVRDCRRAGVADGEGGMKAELLALLRLSGADFRRAFNTWWVRLPDWRVSEEVREMRKAFWSDERRMKLELTKLSERMDDE